MNFAEFAQMPCNVTLSLQTTEKIQNPKSVFAVRGLAICPGEMILPVLPRGVLAEAPSDLATMYHAAVTWTARSRVGKADEASIGSPACQFSIAFVPSGPSPWTCPFLSLFQGPSRPCAISMAVQGSDAHTKCWGGGMLRFCSAMGDVKNCSFSCASPCTSRRVSESGRESRKARLTASLRSSNS